MKIMDAHNPPCRGCSRMENGCWKKCLAYYRYRAILDKAFLEERQKEKDNSEY